MSEQVANAIIYDANGRLVVDPLLIVSTGSGITQLTSDGTAGPGSGSQALTLATVNSNVGSFTHANVTVNAKGLVTAAANGTLGLTALTGDVTASGSGSQAAAVALVGGVTAANVATGVTTANNALPKAGGTMTGVIIPASGTNAALTGTVTPATGVANYFYTVTGATTLNGPASPTADGQKVVFRILNDGSHSVTLATGANNFRFGTDITSYTNSVSLTDYIGAAWNAAASCWDIVSIIKGF